MRTFRTIQIASGGYRYEAIVRNLSSRGALIEGLWNVPEGTSLLIEFGADVVMDAEARWSDGNRVGVRFAQAVDIGALVGGAGAKERRTGGRIDRAA